MSVITKLCTSQLNLAVEHYKKNLSIVVLFLALNIKKRVSSILKSIIIRKDKLNYINN